MFSERTWGGKSQRLALLFLVVVFPPIVALIWLGVKFVKQDHAIWAQREQESRQTAARAAALFLEQALTEAERRFAEGPLAEGVVRFRVSSSGIQAEPRSAVTWLPVAARLDPVQPESFRMAEGLEYRGQAAEARQSYEVLLRSPDQAVRAGALLRLARVARREGRMNDAHWYYLDLASFRNLAFDGMPADLLARRAACSLWENAGEREALARAATSLEGDMLAGRWTLDRAGWELAADDIRRWTGRPLFLGKEREAFSQVSHWLWMQHQKREADPSDRQLRRSVIGDEIPITVLERSAAGETTAIALAPAIVRDWVRRSGSRMTVTTASGKIIAKTPAAENDQNVISLSPAVSGLPWNFSLAPDPIDGPPRDKQRLLVLGLAAILLFVAGGAFVLWRVVQRELAVARLQTDFVAAVSHEFRTPLTSLRHITELLEETDDMPRSRRVTFYQSLSRNTERLHRLVESLLDFARMERGRKPYEMQRLDAGDFARNVVEDFRREAEPRGYQVEFAMEPASVLAIQGDASSLVNALWNLLDNAVKYSPDRGAVRISVHRHPRGIAISVQDHGLGIPRREQSEIFGRFVRGEQATKLGIKGTGLGLAIVSHVVRAHGGFIEMESEEGAGSTFRLVFPLGA